MFELYNAHIRAGNSLEPVHTVKLLALGSGSLFFSPNLPPDSTLRFKPGRGRNWVQTRSNKDGSLLNLFGFNISNLGDIFEFHLVDESELNSD